LAAAFAWVLSSPSASAADDRSVCFTAASGPLGQEVYQQAPPPVPHRDGGFAYFPASAFASQSMQRLWRAQGSAYALYYFQWSNRSTQGLVDRGGRTVIPKANIQPGADGALDQRTRFTSTAKADACTLAQTAAVLGRSEADVDAYLKPAGVRAARPSAGGRVGVSEAIDLCVIPPLALPPGAAGVVLDYEVQDGRTPAYTLAFLRRFSALVDGAGLRPILLTNPLNAPTQAWTGISEQNANAIHRLFYRTTLFAWSRNPDGDIARSLARQMDVLKAGGTVEPGRLIVDFELANTTLADAAAAHRFIRDAKLAGVLLWRNGARQGGDCDTDVNRKIACLTLGACR
jgi:hypothetical protein